MSFLVTAYQVLIASPSDVPEQRKRIPEILNKWNSIHSAYYEIIFLPIKWETHTMPEMGDRPQAIINKQIVDNSDILIGTFWTKLGSHTGVAESGTVEEIQEFMKSNKKVMLYFSSIPVMPDSIDFDQYQKLKAFKEECQQKGLYDSYSSIEEFEEKLFNHLTNFAQTHSQKKKLTNNDSESSLIVQYYLSNYSTFSNVFKSYKRNDLVNSKFIEGIKKELHQLINDISEIKLPSFSELNKEGIKGTSTEKDIFSKLNFSIINGNSMVSKEFSNLKQTELIQKTNSLLGIQLTNSFFYLGNLKEAQLSLSSNYFSNPKKIEGTEKEKEKEEKIQTFALKLSQLEEFLGFFDYIGDYFIAPLVLQNTGTVFNESITVKLKIPIKVKILKPQDFKIPSISIINELTNGLLNYILKHTKDSQVQENFNYMPLPTLMPNFPMYKDYTKEIEKLESAYKHYIDSFFNVEIYKEMDCHVLEYTYQELNPKENISFPSFILFKATETFKFTYEITSKNLPNMVSGELEYQIER